MLLVRLWLGVLKPWTQQQGFLFTSSHKLGELGNKSKVEASKCMTFQVSDRRMGRWEAASTLHPRQPVQGIHAAASSTLHRVVTRSKYHCCSKYHLARLEGTLGDWTSKSLHYQTGSRVEDHMCQGLNSPVVGDGQSRSMRHRDIAVLAT